MYIYICIYIYIYIYICLRGAEGGRVLSQSAKRSGRGPDGVSGTGRVGRGVGLVLL